MKKHPIFKGLKLPGGESAYFNHERGTYSWTKHSGYCDAIFEKLFASLKRMKSWKKVDRDSSLSPDGNVASYRTHYRKGDYVLHYGDSYGVTKYDNYYHISIAFEPVKK